MCCASLEANESRHRRLQVVEVRHQSLNAQPRLREVFLFDAERHSDIGLASSLRGSKLIEAELRQRAAQERLTTAAAPKETLANAAAMAALVVPLMTIVYPVRSRDPKRSERRRDRPE